MAAPHKPAGWAATLKREWDLRHLRDQRFRTLWAPPPADEWVALATVASGRDLRRDRITALAAVRIVGDRLLTSERLAWSAPPLAGSGGAPAPATPAPPDAATLRRWLDFIGSRPLVGYFLDFDLAMIDRALRPLLGVALPNPRIEVSALFHTA